MQKPSVRVMSECEFERLALFGIKRHVTHLAVYRNVNFTFSAEFGHYAELPYRALFPRSVDDETAPGAQSGEFTSVPVGRACREQPDRFLVALQQHFCDTCGGSEVSVDLERRVKVPQILERAALKKPAQQLVSTLAVAGARPQVDFVRSRPAGGLVAAVVHRGDRRLHQLRSGVVYLLAWVKSHQVGDVAVILLHPAAVEVRLVLLEPLLEQSGPADVVGLQLREYILDFSCKLRVGVKLLGGLEEVDEKLLDKALLVGVSDGRGTVLR